MTLAYSITVHDGIFVPRGIISKYDLVYDSDYKVVLESKFRRGVDLCEDPTNAPECLPPRLRSKITRTEEMPMVFLGRFEEPHYGHWLVDGVSRFWYLLERDATEYQYPSSGTVIAASRRWRDRLLRNKTLHWLNAPRAFGMTPGSFLYPTKPIRGRKIIVPERSMHARNDIDPLHLKVTQHIARFLLDGREPKPDPRPVYISRAKLSGGIRHTKNERPIQDYCRRKGFRIVHPEAMPLTEQVEMFNSHDLFIGFAGSAFHSILFRYINRPISCHYLYDHRRHGNLDLIDDLVGAASEYTNCSLHDGSCGKGGRAAFMFDHQKAISAISRWATE